MQLEYSSPILPLFSIHNFSNQMLKSVLKHYKRSFGGFVMELTEDEDNKMVGVYIIFFSY